jgi:hypothetical protein
VQVRKMDQKEGLCNGLHAPLVEARKAAEGIVQVRAY